MESQPNYYELLNLPSDATQEEIRRAYHEAARQLHPDVSKDPKATELFIQVQKAYEILADPKARTKYDNTLPNPVDAEKTISDKEVRIVGDEVNVKITYGRSNLPKIEESQLVYVLLDIVSSVDLNSQIAAPLNVCLVIDRSTSMSGIRMDTVKATAIELLRQLRPQDILSVVSFSDRAEIVLPANRGYRRNELEAKISKVQPSGGTEIFQGLEAGYFEIRRYLNNQQINHIILLTDGRTYGDEENCLELAEKMASNGVSLSTLGIGDEWNDGFLDRLANWTGGSSVYVANPGDISEFLQEKFRGLNQTFAEQLTLKLETSPGILLQYVLRLQPDTLPLPVESLIRLGGLPHNNGVRLLLEFVVAPINSRDQRFSLANCALTMDIPSMNKTGHKIRFRLRRPISPVFQPEGPPKIVIQSVSQMTLYRMQDRINQEVVEGNLFDANELMQHLATQLLARGKRDLASIVIKEAERVQHTRHISEAGKKQIKYGTRALMLPVNLREEN